MYRSQDVLTLLPGVALVLVAMWITPGEAVVCSQCDSEKLGLGCITKPPSPQDCHGMEHCIVATKYSQTDKLRGFTRSCSPIPLPNACVPGVDTKNGNVPVTLCYETCDTSGCNSDNSNKYILHVFSAYQRYLLQQNDEDAVYSQMQ